MDPNSVNGTTIHQQARPETEVSSFISPTLTLNDQVLWNLLRKCLWIYPLLPSSAVSPGHHHLRLLQYHLVLYSILQPFSTVQLEHIFQKFNLIRWNSCWKPFNCSWDKDFHTWLIDSSASHQCLPFQFHFSFPRLSFLLHTSCSNHVQVLYIQFSKYAEVLSCLGALA